mgnify:CR=1 FL=1
MPSYRPIVNTSTKNNFDIHIEYIASPRLDGKILILTDPMLATGGSACDAIGQIKKRGAKHIKFIGLVAAPQGLKALHEPTPMWTSMSAHWTRS